MKRTSFCMKQRSKVPLQTAVFLMLMAARGTETVAVEEADGTYRLYGYKWFSSATDADMTFTLARVVDKQGNTIEVPGLAVIKGCYYNTCMHRSNLHIASSTQGVWKEV